MIIARIAGATRTLGQEQGYFGLPVRDEIIETKLGDPVVRSHSMKTAWEPTPDELARIVAGAPIYLTVLGRGHPPVMLDVGPAPEVR